jgi:hypothetical protein
MLKVMVATTKLATIVSFSWIGGLALVLVARAVFSWLAFRHADRSAARAKEIAEATGHRASPPASVRQLRPASGVQSGPARSRSQAEA